MSLGSNHSHAPSHQENLEHRVMLGRWTVEEQRQRLPGARGFVCVPRAQFDMSKSDENDRRLAIALLSQKWGINAHIRYIAATPNSRRAATVIEVSDGGRTGRVGDVERLRMAAHLASPRGWFCIISNSDIQGMGMGRRDSKTRKLSALASPISHDKTPTQMKYGAALMRRWRISCDDM